MLFGTVGLGVGMGMGEWWWNGVVLVAAELPLRVTAWRLDGS